MRRIASMALIGWVSAAGVLYSAPRTPHRIVATTGMIADLARQVGRDWVEVAQIVPAGGDPHSYTPTRRDVARLIRADIIIYNGLLLEGRMGDVLERMRQRGKPVYAVAQIIHANADFVLTDEDDAYDPHLWMDVQGWIRALDVVRDALIEFDPDGAEPFTANAADYRRELEALDAYVRSIVATIPESHRVLVTAHDAFSYFGRAYGVDVRGIQGLSTESEAGIQDIERLVRFLSESRIPAVFVETSVADKNVRALVEGVQARGGSIVIGGTLFSDAMGPADTYEGTYIGMIDHNATTIVRALGGQAPAGGMQGKLGHAGK